MKHLKLTLYTKHNKMTGSHFKEFKFGYLGILSLNWNPHISTLLQSDVIQMKTYYLNSCYWFSWFFWSSFWFLCCFLVALNYTQGHNLYVGSGPTFLRHPLLDLACTPFFLPLFFPTHFKAFQTVPSTLTQTTLPLS